MSAVQLEKMECLRRFLDTEDLCTIEVHCDAIKDIYVKLGWLHASQGRGSSESKILEKALEVIALLYKDLDEIHAELTAC